MDLDGVTLSVISQRKTNIKRSHTWTLNEQPTKLIEKEVRFVATRGEDGAGGLDEGGQKVPTSNEKISKHWDVMYNLRTLGNTAVGQM